MLESGPRSPNEIERLILMSNKIHFFWILAAGFCRARELDISSAEKWQVVGCSQPAIS
jgi:hypothetical protein